MRLRKRYVGSMTSSFQRARQPHQKAQRRAAIVAAAEGMLDEGGVAALTLNQLAKRVGIAKSAVGRYFETREAILMHILQAEISAWAAAQIAALDGLPRTGTPRVRLERVVTCLVEHTLARPRLCMLGAVVASILERNVRVDTARAFKRANQVAMAPLVGAMHRAAPVLSAAGYGELLKQQGGLVAGFWQHARPTASMREVLEAPDLAGAHVDFPSALRRGTALVAAGLFAEATASPEE